MWKGCIGSVHLRRRKRTSQKGTLPSDFLGCLCSTRRHPFISCMLSMLTRGDLSIRCLWPVTNNLGVCEPWYYIDVYYV